MTSGNDEAGMPVPSRNECPKAANELPTANSDSVALCNRLRQLGVSFINPGNCFLNNEFAFVFSYRKHFLMVITTKKQN